jgi:CBS domain-containing protein
MIVAREWMTKNVITVTPDRNIQEVAKIMKDKSIGSIVVVQGEKPIGIITEKDMVNKICAENITPANVKVGDVMTRTLVFAHAHDSVNEISRRMSLAKIRRMPIIENDKLVGIITETDLLNIIAYIQKDLYELTH